MMRLISVADYEEMSQAGASMLLGAMYGEGRVNLSITGGSTPRRMYELLVPQVAGKKQFSNVHFYNFDEIPYRAEDREGVTISGLRERLVDEFENGMADVPDYYITMGPRSIMAARELVMIASGEKKAKAVAKLLSGEVTEEWPATVLTLHPHFTLIADEAALSLAS